MSSTRPAAVAGAFYPGDPTTLARDVDALLAEARPTATQRPKVLVAPHAGYVYSGPIAATAYAMLAEHADEIETVVLLGPAHRVAVHGLALPEADSFSTPLGSIEIDPTLRERVRAFDFVELNAATHAREHSLEVHLPFLQRTLGRFRLLPLVVGDARPDEVAAVLEACWGDASTQIVVSTDLSHFLTHEEATAVDRETCEAIVQRSERRLGGQRACGSRVLDGLLEVARRRDLRVELLDRRTSAETAGDPRRVVGYASFALWEHDG